MSNILSDKINSTKKEIENVKSKKKSIENDLENLKDGNKKLNKALGKSEDVDKLIKDIISLVESGMKGGSTSIIISGLSNINKGNTSSIKSYITKLNTLQTSINSDLGNANSTLTKLGKELSNLYNS